MGIKSRLMGISVRTEIRLTTGRKRAAAPTFCIKLEITPTVPETIGIIRNSVFPPYFKIAAATRLIRPVLSRPAPIIITAMIEITALDAKPSNSLVPSARFPNPGNCDNSPRETMTRIAVKSIRKSSVTNNAIVTPKIARTTPISYVSSTGKTHLTCRQDVTEKACLARSLSVRCRISENLNWFS